MIEFTGPLTGAAELCFKRKVRKTTFFAGSFALLLTIPIIFYIGNNVLCDPTFINVFIPALIVIAVILIIPKGRKEHISILPHRIYIDNEIIVCVAKKYTETRHIRDVTKVIDHFDYYEICFRLGKYSEKFICQKNHLSKGTFMEFEAIFEEKIERCILK